MLNKPHDVLEYNVMEKKLSGMITTHTHTHIHSHTHRESPHFGPQKLLTIKVMEGVRTSWGNIPCAYSVR